MTSIVSGPVESFGDCQIPLKSWYEIWGMKNHGECREPSIGSVALKMRSSLAAQTARIVSSDGFALDASHGISLPPDHSMIEGWLRSSFTMSVIVCSTLDTNTGSAGGIVFARGNSWESMIPSLSARS